MAPKKKNLFYSLLTGHWFNIAIPLHCIPLCVWHHNSQLLRPEVHCHWPIGHRLVHSPQKCPPLFTLVLDVTNYQKTFNQAHVGHSVSRTFHGVLVDFQCKLQCKKCHIWFFQVCGKNSNLLDFLQSPMNSEQSEYAI